MPLESKFQSDLIYKLKQIYPGCIILKNDPNYLQGFPDLLMLYRDRWAAFEIKRTKKARQRPNQEYYIMVLNDMSYASFVYPENEEKFLDELQQALRP